MKLKRSRQIVLVGRLAVGSASRPSFLSRSDRLEAYPAGSAGCATSADSAVDQSSTVSLYGDWSMGGYSVLSLSWYIQSWARRRTETCWSPVLSSDCCLTRPAPRAGFSVRPLLNGRHDHSPRLFRGASVYETHLPNSGRDCGGLDPARAFTRLVLVAQLCVSRGGTGLLVRPHCVAERRQTSAELPQTFGLRRSHRPLETIARILTNSSTLRDGRARRPVPRYAAESLPGRQRICLINDHSLRFFTPRIPCFPDGKMILASQMSVGRRHLC